MQLKIIATSHIAGSKKARYGRWLGARAQCKMQCAGATTLPALVISSTAQRTSEVQIAAALKGKESRRSGVPSPSCRLSKNCGPRC